jgi:hypothetical protein
MDDNWFLSAYFTIVSSIPYYCIAFVLIVFMVFNSGSNSKVNIALYVITIGIICYSIREFLLNPYLSVNKEIIFNWVLVVLPYCFILVQSIKFSRSNND